MDPTINPNDPTAGDHSFKQWFKLMWIRKDIHYFLIYATGTVLEIIHWKWVLNGVIDAFDDSCFAGVFVIPFMFILPVGMFFIAYKGFYQGWQDYISGRSR